MIAVDFFNPFDQLIASGGAVLGVILLLTFVIWVLIVERYWYYAFLRRRFAAEVSAQWSARADRHSRASRAIRACQVSQFRLRLERRIDLISSLVGVSLLLGLFGTVVGMIGVFEGVMMFGGGGWGGVRTVADGVTVAVMPAMAGMVAALSGIYFSSHLKKQVINGTRELRESLMAG